MLSRIQSHIGNDDFKNWLWKEKSMHVNKLEYGNKQVNSGAHNQLQGLTIT